MNKAFWLFLVAIFLFFFALEQMLESPPVQSERSSHKDSSGHPTSEALKKVQEPVGSPPGSGKSRLTAKPIPPNPQSPKGAIPKTASEEGQDQELTDASDPDADEEMAEPQKSKNRMKPELRAPFESGGSSGAEEDTLLLQEDETEPEDEMPLDEEQLEDVEEESADIEEEPVDIEIEEMTDETMEEEPVTEEEQVEEAAENPSDEETIDIVENEDKE